MDTRIRRPACFEWLNEEIAGAAFAGRWEELERYGWRLIARTWRPPYLLWQCTFRRRREY